MMLGNMELIPDNLKHRDLTEKIIGSFYEVYNELGHGFLESIYEQALAIALAQAGMKVQRLPSQCRSEARQLETSALT